MHAHTHTRTHARTHTRTHAHTHARAHAKRFDSLEKWKKISLGQTSTSEKILDKPITEARLDKFCLGDAPVLVTVHLDEGFLHHQLLQSSAALNGL